MAVLFGRGALAIGLVNKLNRGMKTTPCNIALVRVKVNEISL